MNGRGRGITERLARSCAAHPRRTLLAWGVAVLAALALVASGGVIGALGITNASRRPVEARRCPGGQLAGAPEPAAQRTSVAQGT